ncbi:MAG: hypothetical protein P8R39_11885, partial [Alphaproteobacteria bacterium]|nr:hypothetical protein [Alphaproteobacteria bacterium]
SQKWHSKAYKIGWRSHFERREALFVPQRLNNVKMAYKLLLEVRRRILWDRWSGLAPLAARYG